MNLNCSKVNFTGRVDQSVYDWGEEVKKKASIDIIKEADSFGWAANEEELNSIPVRVDEIIKKLEKKAAKMHPDTVVYVTGSRKSDSRFLMVENSKLQSGVCTPSYGDWQLSGDIRSISGTSRTQGMGYVDMFERRVDALIPGRVDEHLYDTMKKSILERSENCTSFEKLAPELERINAYGEDVNCSYPYHGGLTESVKKNIQDKLNSIAAKERNQELLKKFESSESDKKGLWGKFKDLFS